MAYFNRDNNSGRDRDFGRKRFNDRGSGRTQMHQATCSRCGKPCEVPFRPNGSKPVFCNNCFRNNGESGDFHERNTFDNKREQNNSTGQFAALNAKLDKIIKMLQTPQLASLPAVKIIEEATDIPEKKAITPKKKTPTKKK